MKLSPGMPALIPTSGEWNRHVEASDDWHRRKALGEGGGAAHAPLPLTVVKVSNGTAGDWPVGSVVELGDKLTDQPEREYPWFSGETPDESRPFAILLEPIPGAEIGLALIAGRCIARVSVGDTDHRYARVANEATALASDSQGPVRLLHPPSATGEQLLWVQFPIAAAATAPRRAVLVTALLQGGTALARQIMKQGGAWVYGEDFTVGDFMLNTGEEIPGGTKIRCSLDDEGNWVWDEAYCDPSNTLPEDPE